MKRIIFPILCMGVGIVGCICDCITKIQEKDLETMVSEEVAKQLNSNDKDSE